MERRKKNQLNKLGTNNDDGITNKQKTKKNKNDTFSMLAYVRSNFSS